MNPRETTKAVILARGLGTRMRKSVQSMGKIDPAQVRIAETGIKAMIPFGQPFLDYVLSGLADAGCLEVCLVIGPEHGLVREYYTRQCVPTRFQLSFAIQEMPSGTANALSSAEEFAAGQNFLMLNSDNYYPTTAFQALRLLGRPAVAAFERESLVSQGNISRDRIRSFAVITADSQGMLEQIVEKPGEDQLSTLEGEIYVSMNCWCFGPAIFRACAAIGPSPRGEFEIPDAVRYAITELGEKFCVLPFHSGVLDLSSRTDISEVAARLRNLEVRL